METRFSALNNIRKGEVSGYAVKWGVASFVPQLGHKETFKKGSVRWDRNVALFCQHSPHKVLGNSKKTLKLEADDVGLRFSCVLPESAKAEREALEREDLTGASVGFNCEADSYEGETRVIEDCILREISLVHDPAHAAPISYRSAKRPKRSWTDLL